MTLLLVVVTCIISVICFQNQDYFQKLKHNPASEFRHGQYYRWFTSGFVHGDYIHLAVNMFVLYQFGSIVEHNLIVHLGQAAGSILFIVGYLLTVAMGDIPTYFRHRHNAYFSSVGASGGVSGVLFHYILLNPWSMLGLYGIIPVPAILFGVLYLWYSTWASRNQHDMIDHEAHFYGAVAGMLIAIVTRPSIFSEFLIKLVHDFPIH
jgi:membrane associated rhomboid family serine protease